MDGQYRSHLAIARDEISSWRKRERRLLHDEAVLLEPPVSTVEPPVGRSDPTDLDQPLIAGQWHTSRTWIDTPQPPRLGIVPGFRRRVGQRRNVDRKSTRLNSSHLGISYAVFCLKKKKSIANTTQ